MQPKKKICKGNYRSDHFTGCGKMVIRYKYGLCLSCFRKWLIETDAGQKHLKKQVIPQAKSDVKKQWKKEKSKLKQSLKTHKDYLSDLQKVFNQFIRLRDKNEPCISCGKPDIGKRDASHYFSVGSTPNLRFDEDNVHASCVRCNRDLHGNIAEYTLRLPERIGKKKFKELQKRKNSTLKLTVPEIKQKIIYYKKKVLSLQE